MQSQRKEITDAQSEDRQRSERRLARGLEDVSYLFLSETAVKSEEQKQEQAASVYAEASQERIPTVLQASQTVHREMLISLLSRNAAVLEEGMQAIDVNIPCDPYGCVDLLAVDGIAQLAIIQVDTEQNDVSLLRGIGCHDWFVRNIPIVRRMYQGRVINFSAQPRIFLIAPMFSPLIRCAAQRSESPKVSCFTYRTVSMSGGVGIFFERA